MKDKELINYLRKRFKGNEISLKELSEILGFDFNASIDTAHHLAHQGIIKTKEIKEIGREKPIDIKIVNFIAPQSNSIFRHPLFIAIVAPLIVAAIIWGVKQWMAHTQESSKNNTKHTTTNDTHFSVEEAIESGDTSKITALFDRLNNAKKSTSLSQADKHQLIQLTNKSDELLEELRSALAKRDTVAISVISRDLEKIREKINRIKAISEL